MPDQPNPYGYGPVTIGSPPPTHEELLIFEAIADSTRIQLIQSLEVSSRTQLELSRLFGLSQPLIRHHLERLVDAGLVKSSKSGRYREYALVERLGTTLNRIINRLFR